MPIGVVISAGRMMKTVRVRVPKQVWHAHLRKYFQRHEDFMAHDENGACVEGDVVRIEPGHRSSRHKRHVVAAMVSAFRTGLERQPVETVEQWEARKRAKHEAKVERRRSRVLEELAKKKKPEEGKGEAEEGKGEAEEGKGEAETAVGEAEAAVGGAGMEGRRTVEAVA